MKKQISYQNIWVTLVYVGGKWKPQKGSLTRKKAIEYRNNLLEYDKVWNKQNTKIVEYCQSGKG